MAQQDKERALLQQQQQEVGRPPTASPTSQASVLRCLPARSRPRTSLSVLLLVDQASASGGEAGSAAMEVEGGRGLSTDLHLPLGE